MTCYTLVTVPYTMNGVTAANLFTAALGETPTMTEIAQTNCRRAGTECASGVASLSCARATITMAPGRIYSVFTDGETTADGVKLKRPTGGMLACRSPI